MQLNRLDLGRFYFSIIFCGITANDESVNNEIIGQFVDTWQKHGEEYLDDFEFEKDLILPHDLITPTREDGNPALVYPIIIDNIIVLDE